MANSIEILKVYPKSFRANLYSIHPFRMIGLIDVSIKYVYGTERVTLAFFRSSGTNSGKIKGLWYPIVGIKTHTGKFTEFTEYINYVLKKSTSMGRADKGWLAKSLFFSDEYADNSMIRGFSNGMHYKNLLKIGKLLRYLYERGNFEKVNELDAKKFNSSLTSTQIYKYNRHAQRENFEKFIQDIFKQEK